MHCELSVVPSRDVDAPRTATDGAIFNIAALRLRIDVEFEPFEAIGALQQRNVIHDHRIPLISVIVVAMMDRMASYIENDANVDLYAVATFTFLLPALRSGGCCLQQCALWTI